MLPPEFFAQDVHAVARDLLGATFLVDGVGGTIVEVEAYHHEDPAAHGYRGRTERNASMFGPPGHAYVYRSYGIHWCVNAVCSDEGVADAVLLRALEPTHGLDLMRARRGSIDDRRLCSGPGRLTQALGVTDAHNGLRVFNKKVADGLNLTMSGMSHASEFIALAVENHWRVAEEPVEAHDG